MARTRTFIGVAVGDDVRGMTAAVQHKLAKTGAGVKWVEAANLHLTLMFLGDLDDKDLHPVCRAVTAAAAAEQGFGMRVAGLGAFPSLRRPKTIWAGITTGSDALLRLFAGLDSRLSPAGLFRREDRPFTPHLTLGRVNDEAGGQLLAAELPSYTKWTGGTTSVEEVIVYCSELRRDGPEYSVLARARLSGSAPDLDDDDDDEARDDA